MGHVAMMIILHSAALESGREATRWEVVGCARAGQRASRACWACWAPSVHKAMHKTPGPTADGRSGSRDVYAHRYKISELSIYNQISNATRPAAALELLAVARATVRYTDTITVQHRPLCHELATRSPMANCCSMASMTISASAPSASSASRRLQV